MVRCDGCGINPIIGTRYQCSVCDDFDYCENCEATKEHVHPFLKLRRPQRIQESPSTFEIFKSSCIDLKSKVTDKIKSVYKVPKEAIKKIFQKEEKEDNKGKNDPKKPQEIEVYSLYDVEFLREIESVPKIVYPDDKYFYKTLLIKNSGILDYLEGFYLVNMEESESKTGAIPPIEIDKETTVVLKFKSPQKPGKYTSQWRLALKNEYKEEETVGKPLIINYEIAEEKYSKENCKESQTLTRDY